MRIFICEHDNGRARSMQAILSDYSYKVVTIEKNTDLFKRVNQQKPAVIIINEGFTDAAGIDTLNRLKNDPATRDIPVIFIGRNEKILHYAQSSDHNKLEVVGEPVKIKNLRHYIDRWTTLKSIYLKH
ncbi:MAG: response regulator [Calditrichaeota bacterium]|nr:MAG: response regulator [Calditrichota bacterium]